MIPKLAAIDGPLKGSTFVIASQPFSIGRKPDNTLSAADLSISRHHCTIESTGDQFRIADHESQNGTFVNGVPVKERILCHGDQIAVGASVFVFLMEEADAVVLRVTGEPATSGLYHRIVGESPAIRHVLEFITQVAPLDTAVLICGETGTGKGLAARALHDSSLRASEPFVTVNCAGSTETLLDRELFGYEQDAFPGAVTRKKGKLEIAAGGTLLLDEIAELSPALQGKLMHFLHEKQFQRLGGTRTLTSDLRVFASTSRDLNAAAQAGAFRQDLYFRLRVLCVELPPLRQRRDDIPLLANYFRREQSARQKRRVLGITAAARDCLVRHDWPGNVRELESAIERAVASGATEGILPEDLPESVLPGVDAPEDILPRFYRAVVETKRELILKAYRQAHGSNSQAAALLGLHPNSLQRLVRTLDLQTAVRSLNGEDGTA